MSPWDPEAVRAGAVAELAPWGIVPPDHLPRVTRRRERALDDVIGRAQALHGVLDIIHGAPVDAVYAAVRAAGAEIVHPITDEEWGVRRFFVRAPDGKVVNVVSHRS